MVSRSGDGPVPRPDPEYWLVLRLPGGGYLAGDTLPVFPGVNQVTGTDVLYRRCPTWTVNPHTFDYTAIPPGRRGPAPHVRGADVLLGEGQHRAAGPGGQQLLFQGGYLRGQGGGQQGRGVGGHRGGHRPGHGGGLPVQGVQAAGDQAA